MIQFTLLGITIKPESRKNILEKIKKYIGRPNGFCHIISVNPENLIIARENESFKKVVETAQIQIIDGAGIILAGKYAGSPLMERFTGVDLMEELIKWAGKERIRTMLIGGYPEVADRLAKCYTQTYAQSNFLGITGINDIKNPQKNEEKELFSIVSAFMPQIVFVSFGSPAQELWIEQHRKELQGAVCMGVGGAYDFLSGRTARAPKFIRSIGLEWLYRLISQPWRFRRQLRLLKFIGLVIKEKFAG